MLHKRLKLQIILFLKLFILTVIVETREQILTENELKQKYSQGINLTIEIKFKEAFIKRTFKF